ncbi:MAG: FtsX-like permease family protein [Treponemataceae bacterium]|nr:FtsX-like permease family protein [Treponemataceae bacterium]
MLFCIANAVFDSTEQGIQSCYISSFTGDVLIRAKADTQISLFGDDTPVTGQMTRIDTLIPYDEIKKTVEALPEFKGAVSQVTGAALTNSRLLYLFGVDADEYMKLMDAAHVTEGAIYNPGEKGAMVCSSLAKTLGLKLGSKLQFTVPTGVSFRIRSATVTAIIDYDTYNSVFETFVLVDPEVVRDVMEIDSGIDYSEIDISEDKTDLLEIDMDIDSLFDDAADVDAVWEDIETTEAVIDDSVFTDQESVGENLSWHFIITKLEKASDAPSVIKRLNRIFKDKGWPVEATDWRHAAGSTSLYLYWMRVIFNIGIIIILVAGFIIINNTLIINILDQTKEIGTLRAIGAKKRFISLQYMIETFTMTITSGVLGSIAGIICSKFITKAHITFTNSFLIQLFGSDALTLTVTKSNIMSLFLLSIVLGLIGWLYPVITALKIYPVKAMAGEK